MQTLVYRIVETTIDGYNDEDSGLPLTAPRVEWEKDGVDINADEAIRAAAGIGKPLRGRQEEVQAFLREILKGDVTVPQKIIQEEAAKRGFTTEQLRTARLKLKIVTRQTKDGWVWRLKIDW
jgi:hypothetical protein